MRKPSKGDLKTRVFKRVSLAARALVTIGPEHPFWKNDEPTALSARCTTRGLEHGWQGVIVRVRPPAHAGEEWVQRLVRDLKANGAAAVRVERAPKAKVVIEEASQLPTSVVMGLRGTVMWMVDKANTRDRAALRQAVEAALAAAGL